MFGLGIPEILVILALARVLRGPERLPEAARGVGMAMRELRRASREMEDVPAIRELRDAMHDVERPIVETIRETMATPLEAPQAPSPAEPKREPEPEPEPEPESERKP